jgi:hypothetical protein
MKKIIVIGLVLFASVLGINFAQENQQDGSTSLYTFFINSVDEQFKYPLVGFINIAFGNHDLPQIGFLNWNRNNFSSLQLSFINTVGGDMEGFQMGLINTVAGGITGSQLGFINTAAKSLRGVQLGLVNTSFDEEAEGLQIGFINYAESFENGIPIGLLSIVQNGGYKAVELGVSEMSPFNLSFKIGVEKFYTLFIVSYNPFKDAIGDKLMLGVGFGSIIQLGKGLYLNPEITSNNAPGWDFQHYLGIVPYFGYNITPNLSIAAGPSAVWAHSENGEGLFYRILEYPIDDDNKIYCGARMAFRFCW